MITDFDLGNTSRTELPDEKIYTEASVKPTVPVLNTSNFNPNALFVETVKKVRPSIVSITTAKILKTEDHPFYRYFRDFGFQIPDDKYHKGQKQQEGLGSGIIISADGYILTNYHVVHDMDKLRVKLINEKEYEAKIVGEDQSTEIALIKIEAENLPVSVLGNSDNLQIGEWVLAIGSPLRLTSTVSAGIISALSRNIDLIRDENNSGIESFIQTDAAVNPGNSGGALVNLNGEVIGINTAIASHTGYYMGYAFAIPINIAKRVLDDLKNYGEFRRGLLGVRIEAVTPAIAKYLELDTPQGVHISQVLPGSGAEKAKLLEGDVILSVNGKQVSKPNELQAKVSMYRAGDKVLLTIWRDRKEKKVEVELKPMKKTLASTKVEQKQPIQKSIPDLGLHIQDLSQRQLRELDLEYGILVIKTEPYSSAAKARLFNGDVILSLNGKNIESVDYFYDLINESSSGSVVRLRVRNIRLDEQNERLVYLEIQE